MRSLLLVAAQLGVLLFRFVMAVVELVHCDGQDLRRGLGLSEQRGRAKRRQSEQ